MKCWAKTARRVSLGRPSIHLLFILTLLSGSALSQDANLHTQANVVIIPALVKNAKGEIVYGLTARDFVVEDDGVAQPARLDDEAVDGSQISMVVAIQTGRRANYEFPRIRGLGAMLAPLIESGLGRVAIVEFDSEVRLIQDFSSNSERTAANLKIIDPGDSGAAIFDAVDYSVKLLEKAPKERQRVLLLISETRDHGSHDAKIDDVVAEIGRSNTATYSLAFSPTVSNIHDTFEGNNINDEMHYNVNFLALGYLAAQAMRKNAPKTVAAMTGGEYETFASQKHFDARMVDFSNHLRSRYILTIEPKDPHPGLHQIRVRLQDQGDRVVLARSRYWAVGPK